MKLKLAIYAFLISAALSVPSLAAPKRATAPSRRFEFTYDVTLNHLPPPTQPLRIWIPIASSDAHQTVTIKKISAPLPVRITRSLPSGDRMLYAEIRHPGASTAEFKIDYMVSRKAYSMGSYATLMRYPQDPAPLTLGLERFLQPNRLVPTNGLIKQIAEAQTRGKHGEIAKAYALYNYVFQTMRYDKSGTGWGRGDALWACDSHHGNCTDFHSLFIALARSVNIPARFVIGFPLPANAKQGDIPGYHCWAEFYVPKAGWTPVDISEAWLAPSLHNFFFGSLDANRVRFSAGRDLTLTPKQDGPPVNYFVYPYAEAGGRPFTSIENKFSFRDL